MNVWYVFICILKVPCSVAVVQSLVYLGQLTGIIQWIHICVCCCWCQDEIVSSERDQYLMLFHLYLPVFMQLVNILLTKVRMPADNEYRSWNDGTCYISMLTVALSNVFMCLPPLRWSISVACCLSRVCVVAQYAVLEANGKVNGIGEISHPSPSQTLGPIWMPLQIYHYVPPGSRCAKFD